MNDYFTAADAQEYTFYRIPKLLMTDDRFRGISTDAKLLYGLMLDRMSLSLKMAGRTSKGVSTSTILLTRSCLR